jgi:hypothetical protein
MEATERPSHPICLGHRAKLENRKRRGEAGARKCMYIIDDKYFRQLLGPQAAKNFVRPWVATSEQGTRRKDNQR